MIVAAVVRAAVLGGKQLVLSEAARKVPAKFTFRVAAVPAAVSVGTEDDKVGNEDVDPVSHGGQPQHQGIPLLPGAELPQLEEDLVVIHQHVAPGGEDELSPELSDRDGQLFV